MQPFQLTRRTRTPANEHRHRAAGQHDHPGQPEHLRSARAFVTRALGDGYACAQTAVLLTSEIVTSSLRHSNSRRDGGTITITLIAVPGRIRAEVIDDGSETIPALRSPAHPSSELPENGRGLQMIQMLSDRWSYYRDTAGTVTWFELAEPPDA